VNLDKALYACVECLAQFLYSSSTRMWSL